VNILRNLIRKYLSNPPDSRFQNRLTPDQQLSI
jgi:hypothetical protein